MDKASNHVTYDKRLIVLVSLIRYDRRIVAACWIELVLSDIRDPSLKAKEESLNGDNINRVDRKVTIHISGGQPAS